ncbi:MAG TPA: YciI family protein [Thermomicrobiaceae bacterium]|nr:YciI family protein [Thermomicrobiaceae bacterium]
MPKYVLFYESDEHALQKAPLHFEAHRARWREFQERGTLLLIGPFANPRGGAMSVFTSREDAEEFAGSDPFVVNGVVQRWYIREWMEAIGTP